MKMYSHDIIKMLASRDYTLSIQDLNWVMSDSPQARYEIINEDEKDTRIRMYFDDRDCVEVRIIR